jgi:UDP-N-acetylmuramoyl-L-alanyl-D-glutamate--2,6-diaminopimelate ligase
MSQKIDIPTIQSLISEFACVPGRLEEISNNRFAKIYVDYAHTEDSLRSVLETLRQVSTTRRLITVFGATGDRDRGKRPKMGKIVDDLSDIVILTDDDTYTEDSLRIIRDVSEGITRREGD